MLEVTTALLRFARWSFSSPPPLGLHRGYAVHGHTKSLRVARSRKTRGARISESAMQNMMQHTG